MSSREALHQLLDDVPDSALPQVERFLRSLQSGDAVLPRYDFADIPYDDEEETEKERAAVAEAKAALARGEVYTLEDVKRELGL